MSTIPLTTTAPVTAKKVTAKEVTAIAGTAIVGTAIAAAKIFMSLSGIPPTTLNIFDQKIASSSKNNSSDAPHILSGTFISGVSTELINSYDKNRQTTEVEKIIGELREWQFLDEDWDGEGARAPINKSIENAVSLMVLIKDSADMPEPMLHATGTVSLYWDDKNLYADLEFLGDGRIVYFIKNNNDKHKGVLSFDQQKIPDVFSALINI